LILLINFRRNSITPCNGFVRSLRIPSIDLNTTKDKLTVSTIRFLGTIDNLNGSNLFSSHVELKEPARLSVNYVY
jgi:hypothetical protein